MTNQFFIVLRVLMWIPLLFLIIRMLHNIQAHRKRNGIRLTRMVLFFLFLSLWMEVSINLMTDLLGFFHQTDINWHKETRPILLGARIITTMSIWGFYSLLFVGRKPAKEK